MHETLGNDFVARLKKRKKRERCKEEGYEDYDTLKKEKKKRREACEQDTSSPIHTPLDSSAENLQLNLC